MKILYFLMLLPLASFAQIDKEIEAEVFRQQRLIRNLQKSVDSLRASRPTVDPVIREDFFSELMIIRNEQKAERAKYRSEIKHLDSLVGSLLSRLTAFELQLNKAASSQKVISKSVEKNTSPQEDSVQYIPGQFSCYPASSEMYKLMYGGQKLKPHPAPERDPGYIDYQQDQLLPTTYKAEKERKERAAPSNYGYTPSTGATIHTGPRGGRYYINSNGNKTYIRRK